MSESKATFRLGNMARELLVYTYRSTRPVSDDISREDARAIFRKIAALNDLAQMQAAISGCIGVIDRKSKGGFTKAAYNLWGKDMRRIATDILRDVHGANNRYFATEYDSRLQRLNAVLDNCALLLEYIEICTEAKIISIKQAGIWTGKVRDVKNMAAKWLQTDTARAGNLRAEAEKKAERRQAALFKAAFLAALRQYEQEREQRLQ